MRFYFNLPKRVTKIKIVLIEENEGQVVQKKEYNFNKKALLQFENDHQRSTFINSLIGLEWANPDYVRKAKKEMRAKREARKEKKIIVNCEQGIAESGAVIGEENEGGNE